MRKIPAGNHSWRAEEKEKDFLNQASFVSSGCCVYKAFCGFALQAEHLLIVVSLQQSKGGINCSC